MAQTIKEFLFNNQTDGIYPLLDEIVPVIEQHTSVYGHARTISLCKHVLIELLTNGVKHSDISTSVVRIVLDKEKIEISKYDNGKSFSLKEYPQWPLVMLPAGEKVLIHKDDAFALGAVVHSENMISFEVEEYPDKIFSPASNFLEHYGLIIITKSSASFSYHYKCSDYTNHFKSVISMKH